MKAQLAAALMLLALLQPASAAVVCGGCEYDDTGEATYLGAFNAGTQDHATFQHSGVDNDSFADVWIFDVSPAADGSISADYTLLAPIQEFEAALHGVESAQCTDGRCTAVELGAQIAVATVGARQFDLDLKALPAGRYALRVTGIGNARGTGTYGGQAGFAAAVGSTASPLVVLGILLVGAIAALLLWLAVRRR